MFESLSVRHLLTSIAQVAVAVALLMAVGCTNGEKQAGIGQSVEPAVAVEVEAADELGRSALARAEKIAAALQARAEQQVPVPEVRWLGAVADRGPIPADDYAIQESGDERVVRDRGVDAEKGTTEGPMVPESVPETAKSIPLANVTEPVRTQASSIVTTTPPDRDELLNQLRRLIAEGQSPEVEKAVFLAALALVDHRDASDSLPLAALDTTQRDRVAGFQRLVTRLAASASSDSDQGFDGVLDEIHAAYAQQQPVQLARLELCQSVSGYGVYEPLEDGTLLAGREHPVVVYVEVDRFRATRIADDRHEVRLSQHIQLYNETGTLVVWEQPEATIVDRSRNRRRDFFLVQLVRLPARLGVGRYTLKVRVKDLADDSVDEAARPIQIVADQALASGAVY